jgi:hypothetical protein
MNGVLTPEVRASDQNCIYETSSSDFMILVLGIFRLGSSAATDPERN